MQLSQNPNSGKYYIRSYHPGKITINQTEYTHSLIISADNLIENWAPQYIDQLQAQDFTIVAEQNPQVLLIGTGKKQHFPKTAILEILITHNIGFEIMDTASACRTYNALIAEDRKVVAALLIA